MEEHKLIFNKIIIKITEIFFIVFTIMFSSLSIIQSSFMHFDKNGHMMVYKNLFSIQSLLFFIIFVILLFLIFRYGDRISSKKCLIIEMTIFFVLGLIYCLSYINIKPSSDSFDLFEGAINMVKGDYSILDSKSYIGENPHNLSLLFYYYISIKLFGNGVNALNFMRIVNLLLSLVTYIYLYRITDLLYNNNKINLLLLLLFVGFNHFILYSVFIYTNVIGYSLAIISIYYLITYIKDNKGIVLSLLFIILSICFRINSLIILIAEIIVLILHLIKTKKIINILFVLLFSISSLSSQFVIKICESKYNVIYDRQIPLIAYICHGVNYTEQTPGGYNVDFLLIHRENDYEVEPVQVYGEICLDQTLTYFNNNPIKCVEFYTKKFISAWCDHEYDVFSNVFNENCTIYDYEPILNDFYDAALSLMALGLIFYVLFCIKKLNHDYILILSVVGGFIFHFFWEVKAIYLYQYVLLLLPLSANGIFRLIKKHKDLITN